MATLEDINHITRFVSGLLIDPQESQHLSTTHPNPYMESWTFGPTPLGPRLDLAGGKLAIPLDQMTSSRFIAATRRCKNHDLSSGEYTPRCSRAPRAFDMTRQAPASSAVDDASRSDGCLGPLDTELEVEPVWPLDRVRMLHVQPSRRRDGRLLVAIKLIGG